MRKVLFGLACVSGVLLACNSDPTGNGSGCGGNFSGGVTIISAGDNLQFSPPTANANVGEPICFQNTGKLLHDIIPDSVNLGDSAWAHSGEYPLPPGLPVIMSLAKGDYYYHCKYHGSVQGSVAGYPMWGLIQVR